MIGTPGLADVCARQLFDLISRHRSTPHGGMTSGRRHRRSRTAEETRRVAWRSGGPPIPLVGRPPRRHLRSSVSRVARSRVFLRVQGWPKDQRPRCSTLPGNTRRRNGPTGYGSIPQTYLFLQFWRVCISSTWINKKFMHNIIKIRNSKHFYLHAFTSYSPRKWQKAVQFAPVCQPMPARRLARAARPERAAHLLRRHRHATAAGTSSASS